MAERVDIPSARYPGSGACGQWETLLADALDGLLRAEDEATFSSHMAACEHCTELFEEARRGREWLSFLSDEPEVPEGLLDKILAQTGPGHRAGQVVVAGDAVAVPLLPTWQRPGFMGQFMSNARRSAEPRLMMTVAMAFFSIALTLNLTGVRLTHVRMADMRPTAVRANLERRLTTASVPIVRYYDHLRVVYEVESSMRELRNDAEGGYQNEDQRPQRQQSPTGGPNGPGESRQNLRDEQKQRDGQNHKEGGSHSGSPQESGNPAPTQFNDYLETSLGFGPARSGGPASTAEERSSKWTA